MSKSKDRYVLLDRGVFDPDDCNYQDAQERQIAACRAFYTDERKVPIVNMEDMDECVKERTEVAIDDDNLVEVCEWLRRASTVLWHPAVVERGEGLVLLF